MISLVRSRDCERSVTNDANSCKAAHCTALRHNDRLARTSSASHTHLTSIKCWSGRLEISWCWYCDENVVVLLALKVFVEMWLLKRVHQRRRQSTGTRGGMGSFRGAHGERVEREPITGVWGRAPSGVQGRAPGQGVRGRIPLKRKAF